MRLRTTPEVRSQGIGKIPSAPPGFKAEDFFKGTYWYQQWQIFEGITTPGNSNNVHALFDDLLHVPKDLSGKRVLDIGAWNGCTSFECERRGAHEVIALGPENPAHTGFNKIRDILGSTRTRYLRGTVYDLDPKKLGRFDVVLFLGVLYHLRYPLLGIDNLRRVCTGTVFVETFVTDDGWVVKEQNEIKQCPQKSISPKLQSDAVWQFYRSNELAGDASNWFGPNTTAVIQAFRSAGFDAGLLSTWSHRAAFRADAKPGLPEFLALSPFDRRSYDVITEPVLGKLDFTRAEFEMSWRISVLLSNEYLQRAGGTPRRWLASLYRDLLGREAAPEELRIRFLPLRQWLPGERRRIVKAILSSPEYLRRLVVECYVKFLRRVPSPSDITTWLHLISHGNSEDDVIRSFVCSREYFSQCGLSNNRWLERVHLDLLDRKLDHDSHRCIEALARGIDTRSVVAADILTSPEYRRLWVERLLTDRGQGREAWSVRRGA